MLLLTPKTEILYENEGLGSGAFLPEMEDPEYCKPEATALWDLHLAKRHYHPVVSSVATKILANHPLQPEHKLTPEISLKDPADLFLLYSGLKPGDSEVSRVPYVEQLSRKTRYHEKHVLLVDPV